MIGIEIDTQGSKRLKVVVTGGHPGDPEYGCGGTIARFVAAGHDVVLLYLNIGEPDGNKTVSPGERIREAEAANRLLGTRPVFAPQVDGNTIVDHAHYLEYRQILGAEKPNLVFAHWPFDNHPDHRANWLLVYDAWKALNKSFALYYYEVTDGADTIMFQPTHYIDISDAEPLKKLACYAHASQDPAHFYEIQSRTTAFRGLERRRNHAEAYIKQIDTDSDDWHLV